MAIRYVLVRFGSNVTNFQMDMQRAAAATKTAEKAGNDLALAQQKLANQGGVISKLQTAEQQSAQRLAAAHQQLNGSYGSLSRWGSQASFDAVKNAERRVDVETKTSSDIQNVLGREMANRQAMESDVERMTEQQAAAQAAAAQRVAAVQRTVSTAYLVGGAAILASLYEVTKAAMQFQQQMEQAASISTYTRTHFDEMSKSLLDLSTRLPVSAEELAKSLTTVEQAGFQGAAAVVVLREAAIGATVGMTSTSQAAEDLARTLNGMGVGASQAIEVNNILIAAVQNGIGTYGDFGRALAEVTPLAHSLGVTTSDTAAAIAVMTTTSLDAGAAGMALQRMLIQMLKPGTDAAKMTVELSRRQGDLSSQTAGDVIKMRGLAGTIDLIGKATNGAGQAIVDIFPNVRQVRAAFALYADGGAAAAQRMNEFRDSNKLALGAMQALTEQQKSAANQTKIAHNEIHAAAITMGQAMLPVVTALATAIGSLANFFRNLPGPLQTVVAVGAMFLGTFGAIRGMMGLLTTILPGLSAAFQGLAGAETEAAIAGVSMEAAVPIIGWVAVGISALVAALGVHAMMSDKSTSSIESWTQALKDENSGVVGAVSQQALLELANKKSTASLDEMGISINSITGQLGTGAAAMQAHKDLTDQFARAMHVTGDELKAAGFSAADSTRVYTLLGLALQGDKGAIDDLNGTLWQHGKELSGPTYQAVKDVASVTSDYGTAAAQANKMTAEQTSLMQADKEAIQVTGQHIANATSEMRALDDEGKKLDKGLKAWGDTSSVFSDALDNTKASMAGLTDGTEVFRTALRKAQADQTDQAQALAKSQNETLTDSTQAAQDQAKAVTRYNQEVKSAVKASTSSQAADLYGVNTALKQNTNAAKDHATAVARSNQEQKTSATEVKKQMGDVTISAHQYTDALTKAAGDQKKWNDDLAKITSRNGSKELTDQLRKLGTDGQPMVHQFAVGAQKDIDAANKAIADMAPKTEASFDEFSKSMQKQVADEQTWEKNITYLYGKGFTGLALTFAQEGPKSAAALQDAVNKQMKDPKALDAAEKVASQFATFTADGATQAFQDRNKVLREAYVQAGTENGKVTLESIATALGAGFTPEGVRGIIDKLTKDVETMDPHIKVTIDSVLAEPVAPPPPPPPPPPPATAKNSSQPVMPPPTGHTPSTPGSSEGYLGAQNDPKRTGHADGGIVHFDSGSERHIAQFARAGEWRVWAEPETGGEAYIPLGASKRARSTEVLGAVARQFGYGLNRNDEGGYYPPGSGMVSSGSNAGQPSVVVVRVREQQSHQTTYAFNGPIQGYNLETVQADADNKRRMSALVGRKR